MQDSAWHKRQFTKKCQETDSDTPKINCRTTKYTWGQLWLIYIDGIQAWRPLRFFHLDFFNWYRKSIAGFISLSSFLLKNHRLWSVLLWKVAPRWDGLDYQCLLFIIMYSMETFNSLKLCQILNAFFFWERVSWFRCEIKYLEHFLLMAQIADC